MSYDEDHAECLTTSVASTQGPSGEIGPPGQQGNPGAQVRHLIHSSNTLLNHIGSLHIGKNTDVFLSPISTARKLYNFK